MKRPSPRNISVKSQPFNVNVAVHLICCEVIVTYSEQDFISMRDAVKRAYNTAGASCARDGECGEGITDPS